MSAHDHPPATPPLNSARTVEVLDLPDSVLGLRIEVCAEGPDLAFEGSLETRLLRQGSTESRSLDDTLDRAWQAIGLLPRRELSELDPRMVAAHLDSGRSGPDGVHWEGRRAGCADNRRDGPA